MAEKKATGAKGAKGTTTEKKANSRQPKAKCEDAAKPEARKHEETVRRPETSVVQEREKTTAVPPTRSGKKGVGFAVATLAGIVFVGVVLVAVTVFLNLSTFSKVAVERIASNALGVPVTIEDMVVDLDEMSITVSGLAVANPPGFSSPNAVEVGNMAIFAESLSPEKVIFNDIQVTDAVVFLDVSETTTNLSVLRENVGVRQSQAAEPADTSKPQTRVVVNHLVVSGAKLVPSATMAPEGSLQPVELPEFSGSIGRESGGVAPENAIAEVGEIVLRAASRRAVSSGLVQGQLEKKIGEASERLGIDGQTVDSIKDGIRGLFSNDGN
ncbi:MAG: hypothetical protein EOM26_12350 [Alphaproteobacteria bacterium]|nr:hypothetical protein [Alphaproteobacteria bacterium]